MLRCEDVPKEWVKKINDWESKKLPWMKRRALAWGYYRNDVEGTGTNYTQAQFDNIQRNTNIPVSINYIHPILSQQHAIVNEVKASTKVVATDDRGKQYAYVLDKAKHAMLTTSEAITQNDEALKEMLVSGLTHILIDDASFINPGEFSIAYQHVSPDNITIDPYQSITGADSEGYIYRKLITESMFNYLYGDMLAQMNEYYGTKYTSADFCTKTIHGTTIYPTTGFNTNEKVCEVTKLVSRQMGAMFFRKTAESEEIIRDFKENYFPEEAALLFDEDLLAGEPELNNYVNVKLCWGDKWVADFYRGYTQSNLKTMYYEFGGVPYLSYGVPHFVGGMQDAMDKALQIMILNGILTNNPRRKSPKGAIADMDKPKWEANASDPRVILEYTPVVIEGKIFVPELEEVPSIGQFYPMVIELMKQGMEYSTGMNAILYGDAGRAKTDVFSSLQQFHSSAMKRLNTVIQRVEQAQVYIGKVIVQGLLFSLREGNYPFFNERGEFDELKVTREMLQSLRQSNYLVLAVPSEGTESQKQSMAIELMKISQTTPNPQERTVYIQEAFRLSDMRGFDKMQEKIDQINQMQGQLQQMEEQLKRDQELIKQYENRALFAEYEAKVTALVADAKTKIATAKTEDILNNEIEALKEKNKPSNGKS